MVKVGIIILNYNSNDQTLDCLESLNKVNNEKLDIKTILIDNASDPRLKINPDKYPNLKMEIIFNTDNLGFSGGNNQGMKILFKEEVDYILMLNNDTVVDPEFLNFLVIFLENKPDVLGASPKIYFAPGFEFHKDKYKEKERGKVIWYAGGIMDWNNVIGHHRGVDEVDIGQYQDDNMTDFLTGCCMILRKKGLEEAGLFDDKYFLYYEDADLSERLKKIGKISYVPESVIWHKNAGSAGGSGSSIQDYFITRNRMLFAFKFANIRTKFALIRESLRLIIGGRKWQRIGIRDFYFRKFGKGSYS